MEVFVVVLAVLNVFFAVMYYKTKKYEEIYLQDYSLGRTIAVVCIYGIAIAPAIGFLSGCLDAGWLPRAYIAYVVVLMLYGFYNCFRMGVNRRGIVITATFNVLLQTGLFIL